MADPAGRSNSTFHPLTATVPVFFTVYSPENPVPQSDTFRNVAEGPPATAGPAETSKPATTTNAVPSAVKENLPMLPRSGRAAAGMLGSVV